MGLSRIGKKGFSFTQREINLVMFYWCELEELSRRASGASGRASVARPKSVLGFLRIYGKVM